MSKPAPEHWELQLAALVSTSDLLSVVEFEGASTISAKAGSSQKSPPVSPASCRTSVDDLTSQEPDSSVSQYAIWKGTKELVQVKAYPMNEAGAKRCMRDAVLRKRPNLVEKISSGSSQPRGLSNLISPLGIWTSAHSEDIYLVLKNPGILTLSKYMESGQVFSPDFIRSLLRGVLQGLELCHSQGIAHCALNPQQICVHTCASDTSYGEGCNHNCDFSNVAKRGYPAEPILVQLTGFDNCIEFSPNVSEATHLSSLHKTLPAYWSAPELCALAVKPKGKARRRKMRESGGQVDIWSVGILALTLIERNMALSPITPRSKDSLSTYPMRRLSAKQVSHLSASPKIAQVRKWTPLAHDFVQSCLRIDPAARPTATTLLKHPFLTNSVESCLLSDVSESEASPLEDTYEDSTINIPAPDSDTDFGGSGDDWSEEEDHPNSGRSNSNPGSMSSFLHRFSSDEQDYDKTRSYQMEDGLGSSEDSCSSVKIIGSSDDSAPNTSVPASSTLESSAQLTPPNTHRTRRRGKSDAQKEDMPAANMTDQQFIRSASSATATTSSNSKSGSLDNSMKRVSSESLQTPGTTDEAESPPNPSLIPIHTHKSSTTSKPLHDSVSSSSTDPKMLASRRFQSISNGGVESRSSTGTLLNTSLSTSAIAVPPALVANSLTSSAPGSTISSSPRTPARDRTPSPAKLALPPVSASANLVPGRRSSLPLLPLAALSPTAAGSTPSPPSMKHHQVITSPNGSPHNVAHGAAQSATPPVPGGLTGSPSFASSSTHASAPLSTTTSSNSSHSISTKAHTLSEQPPGFRPAFLSRSMRSRSEDLLSLDKDLLAAHQSQSASSSTLIARPYNNQPYSLNGSSPMTSPGSTASSGSGKRRKAKKQKSVNDAPTLATDETLDKEVQEVEAKWMVEVRKRGKASDAKEKELAERYAQRLRSIRKRYDSQITAITRRDEAKLAELKHRVEDERTRLMAERQKEVDKESSGSSAVHRRNSFSGMTHATLAMKKPQFPKQVLHMNFEKSIYEMDRRFALERQEIEVKTMDDTSLVEREYEVQKFLLEQSQMQQLHELQRQHMEDEYALKLKMTEEVKAMTRKYVQRKCRKLTESGGRASLDENIDDSVWQTVLLSYAVPRSASSAAASAEPVGTALSFVELSPELLLPPSELTSGVLERFHRTLEVQRWRQDEELVALSRDIKLAEEHKAQAVAMNERQAQELRDLKTHFEAHYIRTRQSFLTERINRVIQHEMELADMKFYHLRRFIPRGDEEAAKQAEEQLTQQHDNDYALINQLYTSKRQQLATLVQSLAPQLKGSGTTLISPMSRSLGVLPSHEGLVDDASQSSQISPRSDMSNDS